MRVIISGGGTGGHIYPALAIAQQLQKDCPDAEIIFVGTKNGLESQILPNYDFKLLHIDVSGFERRLSLDTVSCTWRLCKGLKQTWQIMRDFKPDLVIGTGGYVCGPVVFAGYLYGAKTCIQEQNAVPGVTNKILGKFVQRIFLGSQEAGKYFKNKNKLVFTGNPIRNEIMTADRQKAYETLQLDPNKKTILVSGGSRGALSINRAMLYVEDVLANSESVQILHVTGDVSYDEIKGQLSAKAMDALNIHVVAYMKDMASALAVADLAVFRAGAIGLSELAACGVPSVLVPYPYATANHQEHNARAFEKNGASVVVLDRDLTGEKLFSLLDGLLRDDEKLASMALFATELGKPDATEDIVRGILQLL